VRITGSKVHRVWKCPASATLPQLGTYRPDLDPARGKGQAIHAFLEQVGNVFAVTRDLATARSTALAAAPADLVPLLEALELEDLPTGLATEVSFAWNWQDGSARELGRNLPRNADGGVDYEHPCIQPPIDWSCEIPCTLDLVGVAEMPTLRRPGDLDGFSPVGRGMPRRGYVGDYKSGHTKYPAPDMYGQTLLGALCVAQVYGCYDVVVELIHIHNNGGHHSVRRTVNEWDLQAFADELEKSMERATWPPGDLDPVEGPWCEYCDAYRACSAKVALVKAIPQELVQLGMRSDPEGGALTITPGALTVRNAAAAWEAIERIEDVLGRVKADICGIAAFEPIPLSDGRVIGRQITERRALNGRVAAELLRERLGPAAAQYIEESVTLDALRKAVAKARRTGEKIETKAGDGVYDLALQEVERRGGLEVKVTDAVRPHVPKRRPH
jgi:hypothetical protein